MDELHVEVEHHAVVVAEKVHKKMKTLFLLGSDVHLVNDEEKVGVVLETTNQIRVAFLLTFGVPRFVDDARCFQRET